LKKEIIKTEAAPKALGPYSQAVKTGNLLFVSGQLGIDPSTGKFVEGGVREQAHKALENIEAILKAGGGDMGNLVKVTVLLDDMSDFAAVNEVYATFFTQDPPARAAYAVAKLPLGGLIEIESIAAF